jgi:hypothetical protein
MKKIIYVLIILSCFLCTGCTKFPQSNSDVRPTRIPSATSSLTSVKDLEKVLRNQGRPQEEIDLLLKMPEQLKGVSIDSCVIIFTGSHYFLYDHDDGQTGQNCGLFAIVRLLYVLGQLGIGDEYLWIRYTMQDLRDILIDKLGADDEYRNQSRGTKEKQLIMLMRYLGIAEKYIRIVKEGPFWETTARDRIERGNAFSKFYNDYKIFSKDALKLKINKGEYSSLLDACFLNWLLDENEAAIEDEYNRMNGILNAAQDALDRQDYSQLDF